MISACRRRCRGDRWWPRASGWWGPASRLGRCPGCAVCSAGDAAIAANAVLGLMEPTSNGTGGDLFAIVYEARTGKLHGLNASGWSPTGLTIEALERHAAKAMPQQGLWSVTV